MHGDPILLPGRLAYLKKRRGADKSARTPPKASRTRPFTHLNSPQLTSLSHSLTQRQRPRRTGRAVAVEEELALTSEEEETPAAPVAKSKSRQSLGGEVTPASLPNARSRLITRAPSQVATT